MSSFLEYAEETVITIPNTVETDKYTSYVINVKIKDVTWNVTHRYNDFVELHEILQSDHGVAKDLLPPKRLRNKEPSFIQKRRNALENYLNTVLRYLQKMMPRELAMFLNMHEYDIMFLLQNLAIHYFDKGDTLLVKQNCENFTPLQLHAITWRQKQPCPPLEINDQKQNFSHILDFCSHLQEIFIQGSDSAIKTSNIIPNKLAFGLNAFHNLEKLTLTKVCVESITDVGTLRDTLQVLNIYNSQLKNLSVMLLCDDIHKSINQEDVWSKITELNIIDNKLEDIDESIKLVPNVKSLNFENNHIMNIKNLESLRHLRYLNLSYNKLQTLKNLETKLLVIRVLDLSQNMIKSLKGFSRLVSLETLDLKFNLVTDINEIPHLTKLPLLENLILTGNPLSVIVDYRIKVLEQFGTRVNEIALDNEKSTQKELDKVAVLQAFRRSKENRIS